MKAFVRPVGRMLLIFLLVLTKALGAQRGPTQRPKLVLFITIDAMRPDYLQRFDAQLGGGLARLYRDGAVFTNGFQDHAITETAPGHAATMSGRFPVHTGIVANTAGVNDSTTTLLESSAPGASPRRFRGTTLTDWLAAKDPRTRVLSVSRKDRAAILPVGSSKRPVYWYGGNGNFTTSTYYAAALPAWVRAFNSRQIPASYAGKSWELLLPATSYAEPDSVPIESGGIGFTFPHRAPTTADSTVRAFGEFPWMDSTTLALALEGVKTMNLGAGPQTDLLAISLSTTDAVGHRYGPDSREIHDQILRLDKYLGAFFDSLFRMRKRNDVVIALTADHGLTPYPEVHDHDPNVGAVRVDPGPLLEAVSKSLGAAGVRGNGYSFISGVYRGNGFTFDAGVLQLDRAALVQARINNDSLVLSIRNSFLKLPGVARVNRVPELQKRDTVRDRIGRRWLHMFANEDQAALLVTLSPYNYWVSSGYQAHHGSPNDPDARVPIMFYGAGVKPGRYSEFARVVDMAPTLAALVGVRPLERLDGHVLRNAIR